LVEQLKILAVSRSHFCNKYSHVSDSHFIVDMCWWWEKQRVDSLRRWLKARKMSADLFASSQWQSWHLLQADVSTVCSRLSSHFCKLTNHMKTIMNIVSIQSTLAADSP